MTRILIVEDNEMNLDMLSRRLELEGYAILCAGDGVEGTEIARSECPDLILMDLSLPRMNGWEATRLLKQDPATSDIPVIALTAHAMAEDRVSAMDAGCDAYEPKPVEIGGLLEKIGKLLDYKEKRV